VTQPPFLNADGVELYHGDCGDILGALPPESFDMVLTDPPYLVSYRGRWDNKHKVIEGDSDASWVQPVFTELWRVLKPDSICVSFYGWPHADVFLSTWKQIGFRPVSLLAFIKRRLGFGRFTRAQHETAYVLAKGNPRPPECPMSDVFEWFPPNPQLHPNQKPLGAIADVIAQYTAPGELILDPFCGSGTTLLAARAQNRRAVGIEVAEEFCLGTKLRLAQQCLPGTPVGVVPDQVALFGELTLPRSSEDSCFE
jgi:adenine-specific DNA-methyltransferase